MIDSRSLPSWPRTLLLGSAIGLAMAVRVAGGYLLALAALVFASRATRTTAVGLLVRLAALSATAWAAMLAAWPAAQVQPFSHPWTTLGVLAHFPWDSWVTYAGRDVAAADLPASYPLRMAALKLPEFLLFTLTVAAVVGIASLARRGSWRLPSGRARRHAAVVFAAAGPWLGVVTTHAQLYDGIRHLLFAVAPLAVLGAAAVAALLRARPRLGVAVAAVALAGVTATVTDLVALHPYEYVYYNRALAGGLAGAAGTDELDYWGTSFKEGVTWVEGHYRADAAAPLRLAICGASAGSVRPLLTAGFTLVDRSDHPGLYLATSRWHCNRQVKGRPAFRIARQGVPLLVVKEISQRLRRLHPGGKASSLRALVVARSAKVPKEDP